MDLDHRRKRLEAWGVRVGVTGVRRILNNAAADAAEQARALAFDCIQAIEQQQQNLRALQQRITQPSEEKSQAQQENE